MSFKVSSGSAVVCFVLIFASVQRGLAGDLNPPAGPVAPTMKTLTEVEPRIAVNATNTPGDADSVFRISQPGSYYLVGNVAGQSGKHGIEIAASNVSLDLSGFEVAAVPGALNGIAVEGSQNQIVVKNGFVRSWSRGVDMSGAITSSIIDMMAHLNTVGFFGGTEIDRCIGYGNGNNFSLGRKYIDCISLNHNDASGFLLPAGGVAIRCTSVSDHGAFGGSTSARCQLIECNVINSFSAIHLGAGTRIERCTVDQVYGSAVRVGSGSLVDGCIIRFGFNGIVTGEESTVRNCTLSNIIDAPAIQVGHGALVENCSITGGGDGHGIVAGNRSAVVRCRVSGRTGTGIIVASDSSVRHCLSTFNTLSGIIASDRCYISENHCSSNFDVGVAVNGSRGRIDGNHLTENGTGVRVNGTSNVVTRNSASGNISNYDIAGGNDVGPIGSAAASTSPWANLSN